MSFINTIARLNLLPLWRQRLRVWDFEVAAPSLDRLAALALHKLNLLGKPEKLFFTKNLKPGMTVIAEIKTGKRRILDYVLSPISRATNEAGRER